MHRQTGAVICIGLHAALEVMVQVEVARLWRRACWPNESCRQSFKFCCDKGFIWLGPAGTIGSVGVIKISEVVVRLSDSAEA